VTMLTTDTAASMDLDTCRGGTMAPISKSEEREGKGNGDRPPGCRRELVKEFPLIKTHPSMHRTE
jgi:hypothetical protein